MDAFTTLSAIAAPLPMINVDTDMIIPKQFLTTIQRTGLGRNLFDEMRYQPDGSEISSFVLNRDPWRQAKILLSGANFGCGSSREHAPWALLDFGIRCVIAPSFADIFFNNCFKNGILPVVLPQEQVEELTRAAMEQPGLEITVNLPEQVVTSAAGHRFDFSVDPFRKHCLIHGLDDIGLTLEKAQDIATYEARTRQDRPWLWNKETAA